MSKSAIYTANTNTQAVVANGVLDLGNIIRRFGCAVNLAGNAIALDEAGYYDVSVSVVAAPTAIGNVTVSLLNNGVTVVGATATEASAVANTPVNLSFESIVRVFCNATAGALSLVLTGIDADVSNVSVVVKKL